MPAGEPGMASGPLSREQVLDELGFLATVEHALVVEYLSVCCALGHDLEPEEGGATTLQGHEAAGTVSALAQGEMFHLKGVNSGLVDAGGSAQLQRAVSISIASAVDERYARLRSAVISSSVFEGDLFDELRTIIVEDGPTHAAALAPLRNSLRGLAPADFLRATRREAADAFEQRLLDVSDRSYSLVLTALEEQFAQDPFVGGAFRGLAVSAMEGLDELNRVLVQRGLLPPFTL